MGLRRRSDVRESVVKDFGLKSKGELIRRISLVWRLGAAKGDFALSAPLIMLLGALKTEESGGRGLVDGPLEETGEGLSSGLAMRKPPSVWARFRSASIVVRVAGLGVSSYSPSCMLRKGGASLLELSR